MMKKLVLGCCLALVLSDGECWGMNARESSFSLRGRSLSGSELYNVVKEKYKWAIPEELKAKTTSDIDKAIEPCIDAEFSLKNVQDLFEKVVRNPSCSNYVHLVFDECCSSNSDWRLAYVSYVLGYAAVCYGLQRSFDVNYLFNMFQECVGDDDFGLKPN